MESEREVVQKAYRQESDDAYPPESFRRAEVEKEKVVGWCFIRGVRIACDYFVHKNQAREFAKTLAEKLQAATNVSLCKCLGSLFSEDLSVPRGLTAMQKTEMKTDCKVLKDGQRLDAMLHLMRFGTTSGSPFGTAFLNDKGQLCELGQVSDMPLASSYLKAGLFSPSYSWCGKFK